MTRFHGNKNFSRGHRNTDVRLRKVFLTKPTFNVEPQKEHLYKKSSNWSDSKSF